MNRLLMACAVLLATAAPLLAADAEHGSGSPITSARDGLITALTTLVIFALLVAILGKYAWGPIASGLKAREDRIRRDIRDAEEARARAEATLKEYNARLATAEQQVRELMAKATADAEKTATSFRMQAQQDAEGIKERATRDIDAARKQAMADFRQYAATVATSAAEKILRRNLNESDQRDLVESSLDQVESV